ncbi:MAG: hypothetical protein HC932_05330 [Thermales bacterium]|nr:hypothetical protein [Thermales bacterium]
MLSYLNTIQSKVDPAIFSRGVKLYLDGMVGNPVSLLIDNWRLYNVTGSAGSYEVKIPILHLTLSTKKYAMAAVL